MPQGHNASDGLVMPHNNSNLVTRKAVHMQLNTYIPPRENAPIDYYYDSQEDFLSAVYAAVPHAKTSPFIIVSIVKKQSDILL
jgi:hypothetical protein